MAQTEAEVRQVITERLEAWEAIVKAKDLEGWWSYWTPDARVLEPGMDLGGKEFYNFAKGFFEGGGEVFSVDWDSYEVFVHGDVAYQIGRVDEAFRFPGTEPTEVHSHFFARWEKHPDGTWRISRFVAGPRDAPAEG